LGGAVEAMATSESTDAPVPEAAPKTEAWQEKGFGWGALPAVNFNSDEGVGFGALGSIYRYDGKTSPYRWAINLVVFATSKGIHAHMVEFDGVDLAQGRLRLTGRLRMDATLVDAYCGMGAGSDCSEKAAERAAESLGLEGEDRDVFVGRYYQSRYIVPYGVLNARIKLWERRERVELMAGYRFSVLIPGSFAEEGPYEGSRYAQDYPEGESGRVGLLQVGAMVDTRDFESAPTRGYWVEGSVRGAAPWLGSTWSFFGFNATARGYLSLLPEGRLVFADRVVLEGIVGDAPTLEQATPGGSQIYYQLGGEDSLRGVRLRRFRGQVRFMQQAELRWRFVTFDVGKTRMDLSVLAFSDLGHVAETWEDIGTGKLIAGQGGGLRVAFDQNFIVRADVGVSAVEQWDPGVYINMRNLF